MKIKILGYEFKVGKASPELYEVGAKAKTEQSWGKIQNGLDQIEARQIKYSEYRLQKVSGVSINTIKKYRERIKLYREQNNNNLF